MSEQVCEVAVIFKPISAIIKFKEPKVKVISCSSIITPIPDSGAQPQPGEGGGTTIPQSILPNKFKNVGMQTNLITKFVDEVITTLIQNSTIFPVAQMSESAAQFSSKSITPRIQEDFQITSIVFDTV